MKGELWKILNDYEPEEKQMLWLAEIQQAIHENLEEVHGANIDYPHFLERKDDFHDAMTRVIHLCIVKESSGL